MDSGEVTVLLRRLSRGEEQAREELVPLLYRELRALAGRLMAREREDHTLQATALVNEAYVKLVGHADAGYQDRQHFLAVASRAMHQVLVDHARARHSQKRGDGRASVALDHAVQAFERSASDLVALDEALVALEEMDPELARLTELRFFAGLDTTATAEALGVSKRTVERGWNTARAWLRGRLEVA